MRWTIAVVMAGAAMISGCTDHEARQQNQQLRDDLAKLQAESNKTDPLQALIATKLAEGGTDSGDRRLNALAEDMRAGLEALRREISNGASDQKKRTEDIEERLRKLSALDATISGLKTTIDALDTKIKGGGGEDVLKLQKEAIASQLELAQEKAARELAEAALVQARADLQTAQQTAQALKDELDAAQSGDISKHPQYQKLARDNAALRAKVENLESDVRTLGEQKARLEAEVERLGGGGPKVARPKIDPDKYDFTGTVTMYSPGARPGVPGNMFVSIGTGQVPPEGAELVVYDSKGEQVLRAKVYRLFHEGDDRTKPVEEIGCTVADDKSFRAPAIGDTAVWVKPALEGASPEKDGAAGGK